MEAEMRVKSAADILFGGNSATDMLPGILLRQVI
jgi:hypothetical protein